MGIEYALDIRHHKGHADCWCPRIRCDGCRKFITDGNGNVWWPWPGEEAARVAGVAPFFTHKVCPDGGHREPGWAPEAPPNGRWVRDSVSGEAPWLSEELDYFLVYLVENVGLDYVKARPAAMEMAGWELNV